MNGRHVLVTLLVLCAAVSVACSAPPPRSGDSGVSAPPAAAGPKGSASSSGVGGSGGTTKTSQALPGTLTAGDIDDNLNFQFFQRYLANTRQSSLGEILPAVAVQDRVSLKITGDDGVGLANVWAQIVPVGATRAIFQGYAGTNGVLQFFPSLDGAADATQFTVEIRSSNKEKSLLTTPLDLGKLPSDRVVPISISAIHPELPKALDLMLVIDTTASMGDELSYLTTEFTGIVKTVHDKYPDVSMRFGLVVYRDTGDQYVVRSFDFTDSTGEMQQRLSAQRADGGGDEPEAVDQALDAALKTHWREGNVARMLFWVADAPSHPDKHAVVVQEMLTARRMNLHMYPLAASGASDQAEYLMRVSAVLTQGRYLFLTDDSGVGNPHAEPKVSCYIVTRLNALMIRTIDTELEGVRDEPDAGQIIRQVGSYDRGMCSEKE